MSKIQTYAEKLKHPKWQKKRLEILERDGFRCQWCSSKEKTLHVHHKTYGKGKQPWDYPEGNFLTLCEECHVSIEEKKNEILMKMGMKWLYGDVSTFIDISLEQNSGISMAMESMMSMTRCREGFIMAIEGKDDPAACEALGFMRLNALDIIRALSASLQKAEELYHNLETA